MFPSYLRALFLVFIGCVILEGFLLSFAVVLSLLLSVVIASNTTAFIQTHCLLAYTEWPLKSKSLYWFLNKLYQGISIQLAVYQISV